MQKLIPAFIKARMEFEPIAKNLYNPFYKSRYAGLEQVFSKTIPHLAKNGLCVTQTTDIIDGRPYLITTLWHESGEYIQGKYPLPVTEDSQKLGGASTYARRYAYCALLGIAADEDDDGNSSSSQPSQQSQQKVAPKTLPQPTNQRRNELIMAVGEQVKRLGWDGDKAKLAISERFAGKTTRSELSDSELEKLLKELESMPARHLQPV